jgi:hypothetical protein
VARGHALHDRGEDAPRTPVGVVARLLLHLADQPGAVVAELVLQLAHQDLLRLSGAQAGHALELAHLGALGGLQLLASVLEVALAVVERAFALVDALAVQLERALLGAQPLLEAGELGAAGPQLVVHLLAGRRRRERGPGTARGCVAPLGCGERAGRRRRGARSLQQQRHGHGDRCRNQRRQHDLHFGCLLPALARRAAPSSGTRAGAGARRCSTMDPPEHSLHFAQVHSSAKEANLLGFQSSGRPGGRFTGG